MIAIPQYLEYRDRDPENIGLREAPVSLTQTWDKYHCRHVHGFKQLT